MNSFIGSDRSVMTKWAVLLIISMVIVLVLVVLFLPFNQQVRIPAVIESANSQDRLILKIVSGTFFGNIDSAQKAQLCLQDSPCELYGYISGTVMKGVNGMMRQDSPAYLSVVAGDTTYVGHVVTYKRGGAVWISFWVHRRGVFYEFLH
ncbi:MAG TPA: hypothetical protein VNS58_05795 [Puia sp.]|nr:hypothetical protein [Puia sp.]